MSRTVPAALITHLAGEVTTMTACWAVTRRDDVVIRGTQHDRDITISSGDFAGTYLAAAGITASDLHASSDMSPDNAEVEGLIPDDITIVDLQASDIEAGLFDDAEMVVFLVNWAAPNDGQIPLPAANIGNVGRVVEGRYTAEVRGLMQRLAHPVVRKALDTCDAELGDARCGKDISGLIVTATVTAVTSRRRFDATLTGSGVAGDYISGKLIGVTGANAGYTRKVRRDAVGSTLGHLETHETFPLDVEVGDTFTLSPGCGKTLFADCRDRFDNVLRFRGSGVFTPGWNKMVRGPDRGDGPV